MKKNKKGFTLIELLAVIVVLAIIILIATTQVNKTIKQAKIDANDTNKTSIKNAAKTCMLENEAEECSDLDYLQENGYLTDIKDPWDKGNKNLDDSYAIIIPENGNPKVIYYGEGVEEFEIPKREAEDYFLWCGDTCVNGLSDQGIEWLRKENDVLVFPSYVTNINDGADEAHSFKNIKIDALIATSNVSINADFSGSTINVVRIDSGEIGEAKFNKAEIQRLILGNASEVTINEKTFENSNINHFKIIEGEIRWESFLSSNINELILGKEVTRIGGNAFSSTPISQIILEAEKLKTDESNNRPFRNSSSNKLVIKENVQTNELPKKLFGSNLVDWWNGLTSYYTINEVVLEGNPENYNKTDLFNMGLWFDQIPENVGVKGKDSYYVKVDYNSVEYYYTNVYKKACQEYEWFIFENAPESIGCKFNNTSN